MIRTESSKGQGVGRNGGSETGDYGKVIAFRSVKRRTARPLFRGPEQRDRNAANHLTLVRWRGVKEAAEEGRGYSESREKADGRPSPWLALGVLLGYLTIVALAACHLADSLTWAGSVGVLVGVHAVVVLAARRYRVGQTKRSFDMRVGATARGPRTGRAVLPF